MTTFTGENAVKVYQALTIASALDLYAKTGIKPNRAYSPSAMIRTATTITGKQYKTKRDDYFRAAADLRAWAWMHRQKA